MRKIDTTYSLDWEKQANCLGVDPHLFYPELGESVTPHAKAVCAGCIVRLECLNYAVEQKVDKGVWGGLTAEERLHL